MYFQECEYDSVTVHSKLGADVLRRHGVFCGSALPPPVTSDGSVLRVQVGLLLVLLVRLS